MRIIDEKGRLFGKINLIDFLVLFFLVSLLPMLYFGYKLITQKPVEEVLIKRDFVDIELSGKFIKVSLDVLAQLALDDKEIDVSGNTIGRIVWIGESKPYKYVLDVGTGEAIVKEDLALRELPVRLKLRAEYKENGIFYKDKRVFVNSPVIFDTKKYVLDFIMLSDKGIKEVDGIDLYVTFKDLSEDSAKLIQIGDKEVDNKGRVIAEVVDIGKIDVNTEEINLGNNNFILGIDGTKRQINVKLRLRGELRNDELLYFRDKRMIYNSPIEFNTDKYQIKGVISKVMFKEKWLKLDVKFSGVIPELAKLIREGDVDKDPDGRIKAKIERITVNKPSDLSLLTIQDNKYVTVSSPFQKDMVASLDVLCDERDNILYFKSYPIKVGSLITFTTDLYSISGAIIEIR